MAVPRDARKLPTLRLPAKKGCCVRLSSVRRWRQPVRENRLLVMTVALLPVTYVPHEIFRSGPSTTVPVFVLIGVVALRHRLLSARVAPLELWAGAFATFIVVRLLLLGPFDSAGVGATAMLAARQAGQILAGIVLFRAASRVDLRPAILKGLRLGLVCMLAVEAWQYFAGLGRLQELGYRAPAFNYFTESGTYRPFSTFSGPTVFAGYLAMVGLVVIVTVRTGLRRYVALGAVALALLITDTRAAWIAFILALAVTPFRRSKAARRAAQRTLVPIAFVGIVVFAMAPAILAAPIDRLATIGNSSFQSNSDRVELWKGTIAETLDRPEGNGAASFADTLAQRIGRKVSQLDHAHNNYLEVAFFYGWLGLLLFLRMLVAMWKTIRAGSLSAHQRPELATAAYGAFAVYAIDSLFENTWTSLNVTATLFLLVGLGSATVASQTHDARVAHSSRPRR